MLGQPTLGPQIRRSMGPPMPLGPAPVWFTSTALRGAPRALSPRLIVSCLVPTVPAARGLPPTRTLCCCRRPVWGCKEVERRLAGWPGLGGVAVERTSTKTAGRSRLRLAGSSLTAVGGRREWLAKRQSPRGAPDKRPRPPMLWLLRAAITIGRREESPPPAMSLPASIGIVVEGGLRT